MTRRSILLALATLLFACPPMDPSTRTMSNEKYSASLTLLREAGITLPAGAQPLRAWATTSGEGEAALILDLSDHAWVVFREQHGVEIDALQIGQARDLELAHGPVEGWMPPEDIPTANQLLPSGWGLIVGATPTPKGVRVYLRAHGT